jgi:two-component system, OmpR family, phosphate regulon response regulator PhoB
MTQSHLLLVEDDPTLGQTLLERLQKELYRVTWTRNLAQAREKIKTDNFDLIILDVGLPDGSGFELAREVKKTRRVPLIFMTANASAPYRLEGFEIGAEEFIPKPFHLKELFMRVRHVLENHAARRKLRIGDRIIDFESMAILSDQGPSEFLPARDFQLLELLIKASPRVVSRDEILDSLWGDEKFPTNRTVDNIIVRLRSLLGEEGKCIRSVRGVGYQWVQNDG